MNALAERVPSFAVTTILVVLFGETHSQPRLNSGDVRNFFWDKRNGQIATKI